MLNVVQLGLGPLGQNIVRFISERSGIRIVAAVDPDPAKLGVDLGTLCGLKPMDIPIRNNLATALQGKHADVAVLATVSSIEVLELQIEEAASLGLNIVSTCEELSYPWQTHPRIAKRIDNICRVHEVACVGTGINPGFLMDYLPCVLTAVCQRVEHIRVSRIQDASTRRVPFQQKIGAGLTRAEFKKKKAKGTLRHVGLTESIHMLARSLNWKLDRISESLKPVIAEHTITSGYTEIAKGQACGVEQVARAYVGKREVIELYFRAAVGDPESADTIEITGQPSLKTVIPEGVNGDVATCAIVVNAIPAICAAGSGLQTMLDLRVPGNFDGA